MKRTMFDTVMGLVALRLFPVHNFREQLTPEALAVYDRKTFNTVYEWTELKPLGPDAFLQPEGTLPEINDTTHVRRFRFLTCMSLLCPSGISAADVTKFAAKFNEMASAGVILGPTLGSVFGTHLEDPNTGEPKGEAIGIFVGTDEDIRTLPARDAAFIVINDRTSIPTAW